jgi:hypothetical protein
VAANEYGRTAALALMALFGITLLLPGVSDRLTRPLVALGARMSHAADSAHAGGRASLLSSMVLGAATGLLWAPCAGPVLGLILTGAALQGASAATTGLAQDEARVYTAGMPRLNEWSLAGDWTVGGEHADLNAKNGAIVYRFHARDLHLVLGPAPGDESIRFRVTIDGMPPGNAHGTDIDADGNGVVSDQRLYQLVRQAGAVTDRTFEIRFLDPGVQTYVFTFG